MIAGRRGNKEKNKRKKRTRERDTAGATNQNGDPPKGAVNPPAGERERASLEKRRGQEAEASAVAGRRRAGRTKRKGRRWMKGGK